MGTINIDAVPAEINVINLVTNHRVKVDVSASVVGAYFEWERIAGSTAPRGYWVQVGNDGLIGTGDLFGFDAPNGVRNLPLTDLDASGSTLDFTSANLSSSFRINTANDYVIPYVLNRLLGSSAASSTLLAQPTLLTESSPLLTSSVWTAAYNTDISNTVINEMFQNLITDPARFTDVSAAIYSTDPWTGDDITGSSTSLGANPWNLVPGDSIQFPTRFTFLNGIYNAENNGMDTPQHELPSIAPGTSFVFNYQLHLV